MSHRSAPWDHRSIEDQHEADAGPEGPRRSWWRGPKQPGPWRRSTHDRMVGGVAGGIAARFGFDPTVVRVAIALLSIGGGTGFGAYIIAWLLIPKEGGATSILQRVVADRRTLVLGVAFATGVVAVAVAIEATGLHAVTNLVWPLALSVAGLVAVWRGADDEERAFLRSQTEGMPIVGPPGERSVAMTALRMVVGVLLVGLGLSSLVLAHRHNILGGETLFSSFAVLAGFAVILGPWWLQVARDLGEERRQRVRAEERADIASAIHDSVLQTLALIQRSSGDPREVTRLARAQERDLRAWLFEGRPPGSVQGSHLSDALLAIEHEVEMSHGVAVDSVVVGDCELCEPVRALLAAGREAAVNAAKWSQATTVSLYVEAEPAQVSMFVRDRGVGFERAGVAGDRRGISESIEGRMARYGGRATIRSTPGAGTEVALVMPLTVPS